MISEFIDRDFVLSVARGRSARHYVMLSGVPYWKKKSLRVVSGFVEDSPSPGKRIGLEKRELVLKSRETVDLPKVEVLKPSIRRRG